MDKIEELLNRGVDKIYPSKEELEKLLKSGKKITIYEGFDPTGTQLHIGHMMGFRKLAQWQALGHHVIFLIGTGTGQAGDPSGKLSSREKFFNEEELKQNAKDYVMQASKIVNFKGDNPIEIRYNGDWLNKLNLADILDIAGHFTLQQLSERDMFQERMKKGEPVNLREFLYPLLQGYDSVAMDVDAELGGTDQTFNMLVGRELLKTMKNKNKFVMTTPLLTDSSGRKIGKTEGNVIGLTDKPEDLYGKIMSLSDDVIVKAFEYLTDIPMSQVEQIHAAIQSGENPMQFKKQLAFDLVKQLNSEKDAEHAQQVFESVVQNQEIPTVVPTFEVKGELNIIDIAVSSGLSESKSDAKRLLEQGGIKLDGHVATMTSLISDGAILQVGKRGFRKIKTSS